METIEAIYDYGKIIYFEKPKRIRAKIKITFLEEIKPDETVGKNFPTKRLGNIKDFNRENFYEEYISDRY